MDNAIALSGATGRMGKAIVPLILATPNLVLTAALGQTKHAGRDLGESLNMAPLHLPILNSLALAADFDILIDFSTPSNTLNLLTFCREHHKKMVIGTTGFDENGKRAIHAAAKDIGIVFAANFSPGVTLMLSLLEKATKILGEEAEIEIIDTHHRYKKDAPSGTARQMGEVIAQARECELEKCAVYGCLPREAKTDIGFSSIRAGDIIGEHTAVFATAYERLEITHKASNRTLFAQGALQAALWLAAQQEKGLFNMQDVLGLKEH